MDARTGPFSRVVRVGRTGSTNTDLREAVRADPARWPHLSVLVADHQEAGRGRLDRTWVTPPGEALTASVLLRPGPDGGAVAAPAGSAEDRAWLPLLGGLAVRRAVARLLPEHRTGLKWPNDVLVLDVAEEDEPGWGRDRKVAGVLAEALPDGAVVLGVGVNVAQRDLPVPWATSLHLLGSAATPRDVLDLVGEELTAVLRARAAAGGAERVADEVAAACVTLGREVVAELPGREPLVGTAVRLGPHGELVVRGADGREDAVVAGDVLTRVRPGGPPSAPDGRLGPDRLGR